ncbi:MAG: hypothetical protein ACI35V_02900 [Sphingobacterium composti]|uniref:hypothetical protein n=1 Tax=Sphingobacterium composti TaxID=363260 RepID=UPI00135AC18E|nr:hypothetical protein [Sphingobacterium composti Ten et al. 2007 non Yoo et al. 2007]
MNKIIITSATHSLGLRVVKLLENKFEVVQATSDELPAFMQDKYAKIPKGMNPTFAHEMLKLALDTNVQYILPLQLAEIESLSESLLLFEEYGIQVICPTKVQLEELEILPNPAKELPLSVLINKQDLLTDKTVELDINGLGVLSDSEMDFFLAIAR